MRSTFALHPGMMVKVMRRGSKCGGTVASLIEVRERTVVIRPIKNHGKDEEMPIESVVPWLKGTWQRAALTTRRSRAILPLPPRLGDAAGTLR